MNQRPPGLRLSAASLPRAVPVEIHDLQGRLVAVIASGDHPAGRFEVAWNRRDRRGAPAGTGADPCSIRVGAFRAQRRVIALP